MKKILSIALSALFLLVSSNTMAEWEPDKNSELDLRVAGAKIKMLESDPGLQAWFDSATGYAIFPRVGKGGIGIGGARGTGLVISGDETLAEVTMTQATIGWQLGGQVYIQIIFFKDDVALQTFMRGEFEFGAQASAVAVTLGGSATTDYSKGVAVFTMGEGGLMYEATVGGQKFKIKK